MGFVRLNYITVSRKGLFFYITTILYVSKYSYILIRGLHSSSILFMIYYRGLVLLIIE